MTKSWTYDDSTVDMKNKSDSAQMDSYVLNGEWNMESLCFEFILLKNR